MYNNVYQEYINNMLGIIPKTHSDFEYDEYRDFNFLQNSNMPNIDLERLYPDVYKLLYPMIQMACMRNTKPITEETIDEMVRDIYSNFNADDVTILNINLTNDVRGTSKTNEVSKTSSIKTNSKTLSTETRNNEGKEERNSRTNNYLLNDLIRILLIRELLGRPGNTLPFKPGFPGIGPGKHSLRPRNYDIYEHFGNYSNV